MLDDRIGRHVSAHVGAAVEAPFRERGSSGGMVSWIAAELLRRGHIDAVLHVHPGTGGAPYFGYRVARSVDDLLAGAKSRYHPVHLAEVLDQVRAARNMSNYTQVIAGNVATAEAAKAFELTGHRNRHVVAVVGDGALTGGMCWEALNNIAADVDRRLVDRRQVDRDGRGCAGVRAAAGAPVVVEPGHARGVADPVHGTALPPGLPLVLRLVRGGLPHRFGRHRAHPRVGLSSPPWALPHC